MSEVWTVGHSNRSLEEFIGLLRNSRIELLIDVRRFPGSRRHPHFGQAPLCESLTVAGIQYRHCPELGGRRQARRDSTNTLWKNLGFRGYADYMETPEFCTAIERLRPLLAARRTALMCAEALWWQCHRGLIADYLKASGDNVWHLMGSGKAEVHLFTPAARIVCGRLSYAPPSLFDEKAVLHNDTGDAE